MQRAEMISLISLLAALSIACAAAHNPTAPILVWSPHLPEVSSREPTAAVNYQTLSHKNIADSILRSGWLNSLCYKKEMDIAFIFVGGEISLDISGTSTENSALVRTLQDSFSKSNYSMAFPYAIPSAEHFENSFASIIEENCENHNIIVSESCDFNPAGAKTLPDLNAINDHLVPEYKSKESDRTNVVVFCHPPSKRQEESLTKLIQIAESLNSKYGVVYVSDSLRFPSRRAFQEMNVNVSSNSTKCDAVCRSKSSLLEGLFIGIVLLIILMSGICCMARIDTPTRFEAPKEW